MQATLPIAVMQFFALIILPEGTDPLDRDGVERAASGIMRRFRMWEDDTPIETAHWDYYQCCTKDWMRENGVSDRCYPGVPQAQPLVVFPVEHLGADGVTDSVVTPDGEWHRSRATYTKGDPQWADAALRICRSYAGHVAVLAFCHG